MSTETGPASTAVTWLFVPGDRPERFDKAASSNADVVVVDLEDAVAIDRKDMARESARAWIATTSARVAVRINPVGTPWHAADVAALGALSRERPQLIMLPKTDNSAQITSVLSDIGASARIVALVETAAGVLNSAEIARTAGVDRLAFGSFDLAAELGVDPDHRPALAAARNALVLASAAAQLSGPIDGVTADVRDEQRLVSDIAASAALGFAGKLCIHPAQVGPASAAFAPAVAEADWARRVVSAAAESSSGVLTVDGQMVDAPVIARARRILDAADRRS